MNFHDVSKRDIAEDIKSLKRGVSHRAMILALAVPVMVMVSPFGRSARVSLPIGGSARAAAVSLAGGAVTFTNAQAGTLTAVGTGTRINITGTITAGQNAKIINSGKVTQITSNPGTVALTGVLQTGKFAGDISNKGAISVIISNNNGTAAAVGVNLTNVTNAEFRNAGTFGNIKAVVSNTAAAANKDAFAAGVIIDASASGNTASFRNSGEGKITVKASAKGAGSVSALAAGVVLAGTGQLNGVIVNANPLKVSALGTGGITTGNVSAVGISITTGVNTFIGNIENTTFAKLSVRAVGGGTGNSLRAAGIANIGNKLTGNVTNVGILKVSAIATGTVNPSAAGIVMGTVTGNITNIFGKISVLANGGALANASAVGISVNKLSQDFRNRTAATLKVTAVATGGFASAEGFNANTVGGNFSISGAGKITVKASGATGATARGIDVVKLVGGFVNTQSGAIFVSAKAMSGFAFAEGFDVDTIGTINPGLNIVNSGAITVKASGATGAAARAIEVNTKLVGGFTNIGVVNVSAKLTTGATAGTAFAEGFNAKTVTGIIDIRGTFAVKASTAGGTRASAQGIDVVKLVGNFVNDAPFLKATAIAGAGFAFAEGFNAKTVTGTINNRGTISVKASGATGAAARGIDVNTKLAGIFTNTANAVINVSAKLTAGAPAGTAFAEGFDANVMTQSIVNRGQIAVTASTTGGTRAAARGFDVVKLEGNFSNLDGNLKVVATAGSGFAFAEGFEVDTTMTGNIVNTGEGFEIRVKASGATGATARAIDVGKLVGNFTNFGAGTLSVTAIAGAGFASAEGFNANTVTGNIFNTGVITVKASGTSVRARGIDVVKLVGNFTGEGGAINVSAKATAGFAFAEGLDFDTVGNVTTARRIKNSGAIAVNASGATGAVARGIDVGKLVGNFTGEGGAINVSAKLTTGATAGTAFAEGVNFNTMTGSIFNIGAITVKASTAGGTRAAARGIDIGKLVGNFANDAGALKVTALAGAGFALAEGFEVDTMTGRISNNGVIAVKASGATGAAARGMDVGVLSGTFFNIGAINVTAKASAGSAFARGFDVNTMSGNITNTNSITAKATATGGAVIALARAVQIRNKLTGNFIGNASNKASAKQVGGSAATAQATGLRLGFPLEFPTAALTGTVVNPGNIFGFATLSAPAATTAAGFAIARGINLEGLTAFGGIINTGRIRGTAKITSKATGAAILADGIRIRHRAGTNVVTPTAVLNKGNITAKALAAGTVAIAAATGIDVRVTGGKIVGDISNSSSTGVINVTASAPAGTASAAGIVVRLPGGNLTGNVVNAGQINVKATNGASRSGSAVGILLTGGSALVGNIKNSGVINVTGTRIGGIVVSGRITGNVSNTATINLFGETTATKAAGIAILGTVIGSVKNTGTISVNFGPDIFVSGKISGSPGISAGAFSDSVVVSDGTVNAGAATKTAIKLGGGNDTLTINGGKITGVMDGEANTDTLNFKVTLGAGVFAQNGEIRGFEQINVSTGTVILNNDVTNDTFAVKLNIFAGATVEVGATTVTIGAGGGNGASLFVGASAAVANEAVLDLQANKLVVNQGNITVATDGRVAVSVTGTTAAAVGLMSATTGNVKLATGAAVSARVNATGFIAGGTAFTFAKGAAVTTNANAVTDDSFVLEFTVATAGGTAIQLVATRANSFADAAALAGTPNAGVLAGVLTALAESGNQSADMNLILAALDGLPTADAVAAALEELLADFNGGAVSGANQAAGIAGRQVAARIAALALGGGDEFAALGAGEQGSGVAAGHETRKGAVWAQGLFSFADADRRGGIDGYDADTYGFMVGVDANVAERLRLGLALAYASSDVDSKGAQSGNTLDLDTIIPSVYAVYSPGPWFVGGQFSVALSDNDSVRPITFGGINRIATGDFDSQQYSVDVTAGYNFSVGNKAFLTPFVGFSYWHLDIDGYTETGAGAANNVVAGQDYDYFAPAVGARLAGELGMQGDWSLRPALSAQVSYDLVDDAVSLSSSLGGETAAFAINGYDPADAKFNVGLNFDLVNHLQGVTISLSYDADLAADYNSHNARIQARIAF